LITNSERFKYFDNGNYTAELHKNSKHATKSRKHESAQKESKPLPQKG